MNTRECIKIFNRALARNGLYISSAFLNSLPYGFVKFFTNIFIAIGYRFTLRQRQLASESLHIAFGQEKNETEIQKITKECFENLGRGMIELIYFMAHPAFIKKKVSFEGKQHLDESLKRGKGVIAVSAHFGNFPLMLLRLAQEGYKVNAIIRPTRDSKIEEYFQKLRNSLGLHTIYSVPRKECVDASLKALRNNEIVFIPLDQNFGSAGGVFVDFFGQKAATATGPAVFSMRAGSPLLPMFIIRKKDDVHKIMIEPPLELQNGQSDKETIFLTTSLTTRVIERYIRVYPQEWGWMHRRWKSRPKGESDQTPSPAPADLIGADEVN